MSNDLKNLFQKKRFQMHSGGFSDFKLECDALTTEDYETLAFLVARKITFGKVLGVPRGGLPFAKALEQYTTEGSSVYLIADDVLTTGKSMIEAYKRLKEEEPNFKYRGIVVFSRGNTPEWIQSIFHLDKEFWQND